MSKAKQILKAVCAFVVLTLYYVLVLPLVKLWAWLTRRRQ